MLPGDTLTVDPRGAVLLDDDSPTARYPTHPEDDLLAGGSVVTLITRRTSCTAPNPQRVLVVTGEGRLGWVRLVPAC